MTFKEVECSKFCSIVEDSRGWWKEYSYIIFKGVKCSGFYTTVKGREDSKKGIPVLYLKR